MVSRRHVLQIGGGFLAGLTWSRSALAAGDVVEIRMQGNADGSQVWFDPIGVLVRPGQPLRWTNLDPGNSHTATAYHPKNEQRPRRIPQRAEPWHSDYLLPNETFSVTLTQEGVYDYFCIPHEMAGMVGRIIVGQAIEPGAVPLIPSPEETKARDEQPLPDEAQKAFPAVEEILRTGIVRRI